MSLILFPTWNFDALLYNQVHQEQIAADETTKNIAAISVVEVQVIVQEIPDVVNSLLPVEKFIEPMYNQVHQEFIVAGEMIQNIIENSAVQEQAIVPEIPPDVEKIKEQIVETVDIEPSSTSTSWSSTSTIRGVIALILNIFHNMVKEVERAAILTKRMMESPLSQPPMVEHPLREPPVMERDRVFVELDTLCCCGSWSTQCTWLRMRGCLYDTLDFDRARDCSRTTWRKSGVT